MKNIFLSLSAIFLSAAMLNAQTDADSLAPYEKNNKLPAFNLLTTDSTWYNVYNANAGKNVAIIFYSADCHLCQTEANEIATNLSKLKDVTLLWVSATEDIATQKSFAKEYNLAGHDNIIFLKDPSYAVAIFYDVRMTPFVAIYNKKGILKNIYRKGVKADGIVAALRE